MPHKLLLADDSVTIQRVIELTFADEDVQVISVGNGQQAIERAERDRPDIVLADVGMPERDGYEVAAFIKGNPTLSHIPVVLLTGAFEPIDESRARAVGCDGVLVKPFEPQMVISRVKNCWPGAGPPGCGAGAPAAQGPVRVPPVQFDSASFGNVVRRVAIRRKPISIGSMPRFQQRGPPQPRRRPQGRPRSHRRRQTGGDSALEGHIVDRGR